MADVVLDARGLTKTYQQGQLQVLKGVDLSIRRGQFVCIMGPSGSGKSTLLHVLSRLDSADAGTVQIEGQDLLQMSDQTLSQFRRRRLGFVFQFFNLLPNLTALENVTLPRLLDGERLSTIEPEAIAILDRVGLRERAHHRPTELSGGQAQRVAIARAILSKPALLLADEPTGNLDSKTGADVLRLLKELSGEQTILMVTHDPRAAEYADRVIRMSDGLIESDTEKS